jgi:hypothetical protein
MSYYTLKYMVPLRPDFNAFLVLPGDLRQHEAARLKAVIDSLIAPWTLEPEKVPEGERSEAGDEGREPAGG